MGHVSLVYSLQGVGNLVSQAGPTSVNVEVGPACETTGNC